MQIATPFSVHPRGLCRILRGYVAPARRPQQNFVPDVSIFAFKALSPVVAVRDPNYRKWPRRRPMAGTRAENCPSFARSAVLRPILGHRDHLAAPGLQCRLPARGMGRLLDDFKSNMRTML